MSFTKACLPGCESLEATEANGFHAIVKLKIGRVSARFKGHVELSEIDPPNGYRISGEGEGWHCRFRKRRGDDFLVGQRRGNLAHL
jgi:carbon monoxide dehydrogenase subunit G